MLTSVSRRSLTLFLLVTLPAFASAAPALSNSARDKIIQQKMDCLSKNLNKPAELTWRDICATSNASQENPDERNMTVTEAMDRSTQNSDDTSALKKHQLQLGQETFYSVFRKSGKVGLQGLMYGFDVRYTYHPEEKDLLHFRFLDMYRLEGLYSFGKLDYFSPLSGADYNIKDIMYETRGLLGKNIPVSNKTVTPYFGFGYRYLRDDTSGRLTTDGIYGYLRQTSYWYVPIGVDITVPLMNRWLAVVNGEYDQWIDGLLKSRFNDADYFNPGTGNDNLNNRQHRGLGLRGSIKLVRQGDLINFYIEPFIRYWHVKDSETEWGNLDGLYDFNLEKKNKTTEGGVKVGVQF